MKTIITILFFLPLFVKSQPISQRVTNLEIYDINNTKNIKALVKSDSLAASRELVLNATVNTMQVELAATKMLFMNEIKRINDSLTKFSFEIAKYKTWYFDTTYNYSSTHTFRVKSDTISIKQK